MVAKGAKVDSYGHARLKRLMFHELHYCALETMRDSYCVGRLQYAFQFA